MTGLDIKLAGSSPECLGYAESVGLFRRRWLLRPLPLGLVVPRASANPGIAGHTVYDVDDDHLTLVKPPNRQHDVYAGVLRQIADGVAPPRPPREPVNPKLVSERLPLAGSPGPNQPNSITTFSSPTATTTSTGCATNC